MGNTFSTPPVFSGLQTYPNLHSPPPVGPPVGGQTRVDLATLAFWPCFTGLFWARERRKSH